MRRILLIIFVLVAGKSFAGQKKYIIHFDRLTDYDNAYFIISKSPGVQINKYCSDKQLFLVTVDDTLYPSTEVLDNKLRVEISRKIKTKFYFTDEVNEDEINANPACQ